MRFGRKDDLIDTVLDSFTGENRAASIAMLCQLGMTRRSADAALRSLDDESVLFHAEEAA